MDERLSLVLKYYDSGLIDEAWSAAREAADEINSSIDTLSVAASIGLEFGAYDDVLAITRRWKGQDPQSIDALVCEGRAYIGAGSLDEAGSVLTLAVKKAPENAEAQFSLGLWHQKKGQLDDAERAYRAAISKGQAPATAWNNLGNVLDELGRIDDAVAAFRAAISSQPNFSSAHNNLGASLAGQGKFVAAAKSYEKAVASDPKNYSAQVNLGVALLEQGDVRKAILVFESVLREDSENLSAAHNRLYAKVYCDDDPAAIVSQHADWGRAMPPTNPVRVDEQDSNKRLRIGYVSPDFRRHSVSFFVEPLLRGHCEQNVDVYCYSDSLRSDDVTKRLKGLADHWRPIHGYDDRAVVEMVRDDGIDILVDLAGHTTGNRLAVFASRAAPIQMTALGYPATTGLPAMDYRLCDEVTDPAPTAEAWSTETLLRLSGGLHCFQPPDHPGICVDPPMMKNGFVTFGSFNKLAKVSPQTVEHWADVLTAVPNSRLFLKSKPLAEVETRGRVAQVFEKHGISAERLELVGWVSGDKDHLEAYGKVDVALDTFPYNGTTTTCEALWMGVPVVTLAGKGHAARVGASILTQVGRREWIASDPSLYTRCVQKLVEDANNLKVVRQSLRARMRESSLCDTRRYAESVEAAYRTAWSTLCKR